MSERDADLLIDLDQKYRDAHAEYERWRSRGVPREQIPRRVRELEVIYQRVAKRDRRTRKTTRSRR